MPKSLVTQWKRIGRSGPTIDGRTIEPAALEQAAKNYKKDLFTALIWPDHLRFFNLGTVEDLRTQDNNEGGVDLYAKLAPNDIYLNTNKAGQRLFTSMELMPNFRDSGEYYLTGLAATDTPASAATSEMRFSQLDNKDVLAATFVETTEGHFDDDQPPGWFKNLFNKSNGNDMSKEQLTALSEKFTALEQKLDAALKGNNEADSNSGDNQSSGNRDYSALNSKIEALSEQVKALADTVAAGDQTNDKNEYSQLKDELKQLREDFNAALTAENGTDGGEDTGGETDISNYI